MTLSIKGLKPTFITIDYAADGAKTSAAIRFHLSPTSSTTFLEVGKRHALVSWRQRPFLAFSGKRRIRDFSIVVERRSECSPEEVFKELGLSNAELGFLAFQPPKKRGRFRPAWPAIVTGRIFVSDELHESLRNLVQTVSIGTWLKLALEIEEGGLHYGWEPDGSRMIWKAESGDEHSFLNVTEIRISSHRFGPLRNFFLRLLAFAVGE